MLAISSTIIRRVILTCLCMHQIVGVEVGNMPPTSALSVSDVGAHMMEGPYLLSCGQMHDRSYLGSHVSRPQPRICAHGSLRDELSHERTGAIKALSIRLSVYVDTLISIRMWSTSS
ncbi:hypothetical protein EI94DRAFT_54687 [Lactarius quietus]|nr:hypothetical protein EI94DRAFT_54687 [Lactarius quietus]